MFSEEELNAEWEKEPGPFGKYYRMVEGQKEYEPSITTMYGDVTLSQYKRMLARKEGEDE